MPIVDIQKFIGDKRIAFLMAWDKRLGENSMISKFVVKDVARLIARKYITIKSQSIIKDTYEPAHDLFLKRKHQYAIAISDKPMGSGSFKLIKPLFTTSNLIQYQKMYIQVPEMYVPFDIITNNVGSPKKNGSIRLTLQTFETDLHKRFKNWMDNIDESVGLQSTEKYHPKGGKAKTLEGLEKIYLPTFKKRCNMYRNEIEYPSSMNVKIMNVDNSNICYFSGKSFDRFSVRYAIDKKILGRGSCVKPLISLVGVWFINGQMMIQWSVEQMLITKTSNDFFNDKCPIVDDGF